MTFGTPGGGGSDDDGRSNDSGAPVKRATLDAPRCPVCSAPLLPIVYGMVAGPMDGAILGGCLVDVDNPTHGCEDCGWQGIVVAPPDA